MSKHSVSLTAAFFLFISACAEVDYVGESYSPTDHVDVYYSENDVEKDYKVMGHAVAHAGDFVSTEKLRDALIKEARKRGADGLIMYGLDRIRGGDSTGKEDETQIRAEYIKYKT